MARKRTKKALREQLGNLAAAIARCHRTGEVFKKPRKDGAIPTRPTIPCIDHAESVVLEECIALLKRLRITANRMNNGKFDTGSGFRQYGIKGAGDIVGLLPGGRHLEVECKRGCGGYLSPDQQERKRKIEESGGLYIIAHSSAELHYLIKPHLQVKTFEEIIA